MITRILKYFFSILIFLIFIQESKASEIVLTDGYKSDYLGKEIEVLEDKTKTLTINDIASSYNKNFVVPDKKIPSFGFTDSAYWVKINVENKSKIKRWFLELDFERLNKVELYIPKDNSFIVKKSGIAYHKEIREIKNRGIAFELFPEKETIYLKVESEKSAMQLAVIILTPEDFTQKTHNEELLFSILYGILITLIIYNFVILCILKDISYFYYCINCLAILTFQMATSSYGYYYVWSDYLQFNMMAPFTICYIFYISSSLFLITFLELKKKTVLYKILVFIITFDIIACLITFISFNARLSIVFNLISVIALLAPAHLYFSKNNNLYVRIIAFSWALTVIGAFIFIMNRVGVIPKSFFIDNIFLIVLCTQAIIISLALAAKFKFYKDEKNKYYQELEKANIELSGYKNHLEELVQEKTKELEEAKNGAENLAELKSNFLSSMSHEIRTPMNSVIGMSELLGLTTLDKEQKSFVGAIKSSGEVLISLINNILDFSKIESNKVELEMNEIDISDCLENIIDIFYFQVNEKKIELLYLIDSDVPQIIGDITRLKQILINLVSNALKFTSEGEIVIHVKNKLIEQDRCELVFSVKDTGIGIPEDKKSKIFKSFSQADISTNRKFGGTGLGLTISKKLSNLMNGDIWFENNTDKGTTFFFNIRASIGNEKTNFESFNNKKVLIISNSNNLVADIIKYYCQEMGMVADLSSNISEAENYDLCIFNKNDLSKLPENIKTPLIVLDFNNQKIYQEGNYFFISKPLKKSVLSETINLALFNKKYVQKSNPLISELKLSTMIPLKILLAEDNLMNQKLAIKVFEKLGYEIDIANNGLEVLSFYKNSKYDLIFMDIQMPEMDGIKTIETLIELYGKDLPKIIAFTANVMPEDKINYLRVGFDDCLAKPFKIKEIETIIKESNKLNVSSKSRT